MEKNAKRGGWGSGRGLLNGNGLSMAEFADVLSSNLDRPVKDLTELQGVYDFKLKWTPEDTASASDNSESTSLFAAVQEQLGLRLEARKLPIGILVIDHVEKVPTEN